MRRSPSNGVDMREAALKCAASLWAVFPCQNKRPLIAGGFKNASHNPKQVDAWWRKWPDAQIGAALPLWLLVLDVDGEVGRKSLLALQGQHIPLPATLTVHTGGGGLHYFFGTAEALRQTTGLLGDGLDTRIPGKGYVILPPSLHENGTRYQWFDESQFIAPLPGWMARLLRYPPKSYSTPLSTTRSTTKYAQAALEGEASNVASSIKGQRNSTLHIAALKLGTLVGAGVLEEDAVWMALTDASHVNSYIGDKGLVRTESTIRSGLMWGIAHPRELS